MNYRFLVSSVSLIALTFFDSANSVAASNVPAISTYWSPHHQYCCQILSSDTSDQEILFKKSPSDKPEKLLSTPRWARILWSPEDAWFCIEDDWDPDENKLYVYYVRHNGSIEKIWSSLDAAPDTYWKLLGWRMDQGLIHVQCDYAKDYNHNEKGWGTKTYFIPIFLPQQITLEEQYIAALAGEKRQVKNAK